MSSSDPNGSSLPSDRDGWLSNPFHVQLFGHAGGELGGDVEELLRFLGQQPQVYFEGDGSFGWTGPGWALYAMLYDRAEKLQYMELQGRCPRPIWNQLIAKLTTLGDTVQVTMLPGGRLYGLQEFEAFAWSATF